MCSNTLADACLAAQYYAKTDLSVSGWTNLSIHQNIDLPFSFPSGTFNIDCIGTPTPAPTPIPTSSPIQTRETLFYYKMDDVIYSHSEVTVLDGGCTDTASSGSDGNCPDGRGYCWIAYDSCSMMIGPLDTTGYENITLLYSIAGDNFHTFGECRIMYTTIGDTINWNTAIQMTTDTFYQSVSGNFYNWNPTADDNANGIHLLLEGINNGGTQRCYYNEFTITGNVIQPTPPLLNPTTAPSLVPSIAPTQTPTLSPSNAPIHPTFSPSYPTLSPTSAPSMAPIAKPTRSPTAWCPMLNVTVLQHNRNITTRMPTMEPIARRRNLLTVAPTATPTPLPTPNVTIFEKEMFEGLYVYVAAVNHLPVFEAPDIGNDKRIYYNGTIPNGYWIIEGEGLQTLSYGPTSMTFPSSSFIWRNNMIFGIFNVSFNCLPMTLSPSASPSIPSEPTCDVACIGNQCQSGGDFDAYCDPIEDLCQCSLVDHYYLSNCQCILLLKPLNCTVINIKLNDDQRTTQIYWYNPEYYPIGVYFEVYTSANNAYTEWHGYTANTTYEITTVMLVTVRAIFNDVMNGKTYSDDQICSIHTISPTASPSVSPTTPIISSSSSNPSQTPTSVPSAQPSVSPSFYPSLFPSFQPSSQPIIVSETLIYYKMDDAISSHPEVTVLDGVFADTASSGSDPKCPSGDYCWKADDTFSMIIGPILTTGYENITLLYSIRASGLFTSDECRIMYTTTGQTTNWTTVIRLSNDVSVVSSQFSNWNPTADDNGNGIRILLEGIDIMGGQWQSCYYNELKIVGNVIAIQYPTSMPSTAPTTSPTISLSSSNPSQTPTTAPLLYPSMFPSFHPSSQPSQTPTSSPTNGIVVHEPTANTIPPTKAPTLSPSSHPTEFVITSETPTKFPSRFPSNAPNIATSLAPTTRLPTYGSVPTLSPTNSRLNIYFMCRYNDKPITFYTIYITLSKYAEIVLNATLSSIQSVTYHSIDYEDGMLWEYAHWNRAGIIDFKMCSVFTDVQLDGCVFDDMFESSDDDDGEYIAFGTFGIVADTALYEYLQYLMQQMMSDAFRNVFETNVNNGLNDEINMNTRRRRNLLDDVDDDRYFEVISVQIVDPFNITTTEYDDLGYFADNNQSNATVIWISVIVSVLIIIMIVAVVLYYVKFKEKDHDREEGKIDNIIEMNQAQNEKEGEVYDITGNNDDEASQALKANYKDNVDDDVVSAINAYETDEERVNDDDIVDIVNKTPLGPFGDEENDMKIGNNHPYNDDDALVDIVNETNVANQGEYAHDIALPEHIETTPGMSE